MENKIKTFKVYLDEKGFLKDLTFYKLIEGEHKASRICVYADFNVDGFDVSITLQRQDGFVCGAFPMLAGFDVVENRAYHYYDLTQDDTAIAGALQIAFKYELYQYDELLDDVVPTFTKPTAKITIPIIESLKGQDDKYLNMEYRIKKLEQEIQNINLSEFLGIQISFEEPECKKKGALWGQIISIDN